MGGDSVRGGAQDTRAVTMAGSAGTDWGTGTKDRQQTNFSQPEQSYEAAFKKVGDDKVVWRQGSGRNASSSVATMIVTTKLSRIDRLRIV